MKGMPELLLLQAWPGQGLLSPLLLEELAPLPVAVHQAQAVDLELEPGFLRDDLHMPFQQARKLMDDLLMVGVGLGAAHQVCF